MLLSQGDPGYDGAEGESGPPGFYGEAGEPGPEGETGMEKLIYINMPMFSMFFKIQEATNYHYYYYYYLNL